MRTVAATPTLPLTLSPSLYLSLYLFLPSRRSEEEAEFKNATDEEELPMNGTRMKRSSILSLNDISNINREPSDFYKNVISSNHVTPKGSEKDVFAANEPPLMPPQHVDRGLQVQAKAKVKRKKIVINPEFEREISAVTTYRDPELARYVRYLAAQHCLPVSS